MNKKKSNFKDDFKKNPVVFSLIFIGLAVIGLVILLMNLDISGPIWPSSTDIYKKKEGLKKAQKELQLELNLLHEKEENLRSFIKNSANFWVIERDGDPKVDVQKHVSNAAAEHNFVLSYVGAVRANKITDGVFLMSSSIKGEGSFQGLTEFLGEIESMQPRFYWQNLLLRPKSTKTPDILTISGTIQVVTVEDEKISKLLLDKK